jgi:hypothetical protein
MLYRFRQKYLMIWKHSCKWNRWRRELVLESTSSEIQSISVAMERWSVEDRAFALETYLKNNDSVIVAQRTFRRHFNKHRNDSVRSHNTLLCTVLGEKLQRNTVCRKRKSPGRDPLLRTLANIEQVLQAFVRSLQWSASINTIAIRMSDRTVRRILHENLNFPP